MAWIEPSQLAVVVGDGVLLIDVDGDAARPSASVLLSDGPVDHVAYDRAARKVLVAETAGAVGALYELDLDDSRTPVLTPIEQDSIDVLGVDGSLTSLLASQNVTGLHAHAGMLFTLCRSCMSLIQASTSGEVLSSRRFGSGIPRLVDAVWELPPPPDAFTFTPNGEYLAVVTGDSVLYYCQGDAGGAAASKPWGNVTPRARRGVQPRSGRLPVAGNGAANSAFLWLPEAVRPTGGTRLAPSLDPIDPARVITAAAPTPAPPGDTAFDIDQFFSNQGQTAFEYDVLRYQPTPPPIVWPREDWRPPSQPPP